MNRRQTNKTIAGLVGGLLVAPSIEIATLWADDLLSLYSKGITACHDLYKSGNTHHAEAILPLYAHQTALLAQRSSPPLQQSAARLTAQAKCLACELATDREDFGTAQREGEQAFSYAQLAGDVNLQVVACIRLANINFHRKLSTAALKDYAQAASLLNGRVTPLLKGRVYAGLAEVYAMRGQRFLQDAMNALGLAYEYYPAKPEEDPAYPLIRSSRYSLYVFGDAQSRLFLGQPKEAEQALIAMQKETNDPEVEPITRLDLLYYRAEIHIQKKELPTSTTTLIEGAMLAKSLGSRLYFNKLAVSYHTLQNQWPHENLAELEEVFQSW